MKVFKSCLYIVLQPRKGTLCPSYSKDLIKYAVVTLSPDDKKVSIKSGAIFDASLYSEECLSAKSIFIISPAFPVSAFAFSGALSL